MGFKEQFGRGKGELLIDRAICHANRKLFAEFFAYEEYKLKRINGLSALDEPSYRTLYGYLLKFRNVNKWFANKPWTAITKEDLKRVYDDLEDGKITNYRGLPFKDRSGYYNKIFKSKPFRLAGKAELARDVIEFTTPDHDKEVRYVTDETFRKMVSIVSNPTYLLLFWLAWDIGENIGALLKLTGINFVRQLNKQTKEPEYLVNLPRDMIKRSRRARTEPTLYAETVRYADMVLADLGPDDKLFAFEHRQALKIMHGVAAKANAKCIPDGKPVTWKDLRSGMACHLLKSGWTREEVDARLGHTPQSKALNAYINYLAIDRERPKKRLFDSSLEEIQNELEETKRREKLSAERIRRQGQENDQLKSELDRTQEDVQDLRKLVERSIVSLTSRHRKSVQVK